MVNMAILPLYRFLLDFAVLDRKEDDNYVELTGFGSSAAWYPASGFGIHFIDLEIFYG